MLLKQRRLLLKLLPRQRLLATLVMQQGSLLSGRSHRRLEVALRLRQLHQRRLSRQVLRLLLPLLLLLLNLDLNHHQHHQHLGLHVYRLDFHQPCRGVGLGGSQFSFRFPRQASGCAVRR